MSKLFLQVYTRGVIFLLITACFLWTYALGLKQDTNSSSLYDGSICSCETIGDLEQFISDLTLEDLFLFDFDNALFEPDSDKCIGSDQWFNKGLEYLKKNNIVPEKDAFKTMLSISHKAHYDVKVSPVERELTLEIMRKIQSSPCESMVLTSRSIVQQTFKQIKNIPFDFSKSAPSTKEFTFKLDKDTAVYKDGFYFCGSNNKGCALMYFLKKIGATYKRIFFLDDRYENLVVVKLAAEEMGASFKGFHYVHLEEKVKNFKFDATSLDPYLEAVLKEPIVEFHPSLV